MVDKNSLITNSEITRIIYDSCCDYSKRNEWWESIKKYATEVNREEGYVILDCIGGTDKHGFDYTECWSFLPEQLDPDYKFKYNIGDIITDGKSKYRIEILPILDSRVPNPEEWYNPLQLEDCGNRYGVKEYNETDGEFEDYIFPLYAEEGFELAD